MRFQKQGVSFTTLLGRIGVTSFTFYDLMSYPLGYYIYDN